MGTPQQLLAGKNGLIFGVANKNSLAWHIAKAAHAHGARIALSVANERFKEKAAPLAEQLDSAPLVICDVGDDASISKAFEEVGRIMPKLDFLVHAVAFAEREDLEGRFVETSRKGYALAQDISAYSLTAIARAAEALMGEGSSILTLSYLGATRAVPSYNVMGVAKAALEASVRYLAVDLGPKGIRVNTLSAGPIKTLSAAAVKGLKDKIDLQQKVTPLRRNVNGDDVGGAAVFLLSDLSAGVTGDVLFVDCGYHALGAYDPGSVD